ncbi:nucleotidyltransferase domain-containing protein [Candidatus Pacearchaeota archaeon]|nr:nucleotidyltransferase domain-containing protein [Candidatus Pacearchaeota archaeon]
MNFASFYPARVLPDVAEMRELKKKAQIVTQAIKLSLNTTKKKADVFIGGSFARGTLLKRDQYDIDLFVRFKESGDLSALLEKIVKQAAQQLGISYQRVHGSRDYFSFMYQEVEFEIVPVKHIRRPQDAENVTDLSYFHVAYVTKALSKRLRYEVGIAKAFCKAQKVYGAESWIGGFSGYALECLIIQYGSFLSMLRAFAGASPPVILDPRKHYATKQAVLRNLQEGKLQSPIIFIDPTWKERNILSALRPETFQRFQKAAQIFLKKPSTSFFTAIPIKFEAVQKEARKLKSKAVFVRLATDRQAGAIAGAKLVKGGNYLLQLLKRSFEVRKQFFHYADAQDATFILVLAPKKEMLIIGPPIGMKKHVSAFKKKHRNAFVKRGRIYAKGKKTHDAVTAVKELATQYASIFEGMGITQLSVEE